MKPVLIAIALAATLSGARAEHARIEELDEAYSDLTPLCMTGESDEGGKVSTENWNACRSLVYVISTYNALGICITADLARVPCPQPK